MNRASGEVRDAHEVGSALRRCMLGSTRRTDKGWIKAALTLSISSMKELHCQLALVEPDLAERAYNQNCMTRKGQEKDKLADNGGATHRK